MRAEPGYRITRSPCLGCFVLGVGVPSREYNYSWSVSACVWQCNRVCGDGEQWRRVWCKMSHAVPGAVSEILPDAWCDGGSRPADRQQCNARSCSGAEWMTSEWSGVSCARTVTTFATFGFCSMWCLRLRFDGRSTAYRRL